MCVWGGVSFCSEGGGGVIRGSNKISKMDQDLSSLRSQFCEFTSNCCMRSASHIWVPQLLKIKP